MYVDDCQATRPLHCPGAYYLERTLPTIQDIVTQLTNNQSCSELELIDLPIPCDDSRIESQDGNIINGKYYSCVILAQSFSLYISLSLEYKYVCCYI